MRRDDVTETAGEGKRWSWKTIDIGDSGYSWFFRKMKTIEVQ